MKILIINFMETLSPGGINKTVQELGKNLSKNGHFVTVLQPNLKEYSPEETYEGFRIIRIKSRFKNHLYGFCPEFFPYFKNNIKNLDPDIIHMQGYQNLLLPELLLLVNLMKLRIPIILTPHYDPLNRGTILGKLLGATYDKFVGKSCLEKCDYIISISDFEANNIKIFNSQVKVIPHGVDLLHIKKKKKDGMIKLLYVGYLLDYKGVQYIIYSVKELVNSGVKNIIFTIIGEGKYKDQLQKLSKKLNIEDHIIWKPFLSHKNVLEEMMHNDIFLLLSKTEGYGIVVAEALSMGTPSIVTKRTALEEFTKEKGCFGVDCPPKPQEVANLIMEIYNSDLEVGPFSGKIKTWDKVVSDYETFYKVIVGGK